MASTAFGDAVVCYRVLSDATFWIELLLVDEQLVLPCYSSLPSFLSSTNDTVGSIRL